MRSKAPYLVDIGLREHACEGGQIRPIVQVKHIKLIDFRDEHTRETCRPLRGPIQIDVLRPRIPEQQAEPALLIAWRNQGHFIDHKREPGSELAEHMAECIKFVHEDPISRAIARREGAPSRERREIREADCVSVIFAPPVPKEYPPIFRRERF